MSFFDLNVTSPIWKSNGVTPLGPTAQPNIIRMNIGGVLEEIRLITQGTAGYLGVVSRDINGGYNVYSNISVIPAQQVPIYSCSGWGSAIFNIAKLASERACDNVYDVQTGTVSNLPNPLDPTYVNSSALIAVPSGTQSALWTVPHSIPIVQHMFNGIVGWWELGNPLAQLSVQLTPAYSGNASPYGMASQVPGAMPYFAAAGVPGTNNATLAAPVVDVVRILWDTPINPQDRPPVTFVNTIIEDTFQNNVPSTNFLKYTYSPLSGYVARTLLYVNDSTTGKGVAPTMMLAANSNTLNVGDGTSLIAETIYENAIRQRYQLRGTDLPQGCFYFDFLGPDLTWQAVLSTYDEANINHILNFSSNLGATSYGKVIRQMLKPLQYTAK